MYYIFSSPLLISSLCYFYLEEISQVLDTHTNYAAPSYIFLYERNQRIEGPTFMRAL